MKSQKPKPSSGKKLSYKQQQELNGLPARLEQLEQQIEALQEAINSPDFFTQPEDVTQEKLQQLAAVESELEEALARWEELEELAAG